jgi:hypothetical protein
MRYFLDTEFNDYQGELISLALCGEDGREIYVVMPAAPDRLLTPWVAQNVMPVLEGTEYAPAQPKRPLQRNSATMLVGLFLAEDPEPMVLADHPIDIAHLMELLVMGPGKVFPIPALQAVYFDVPGFSVKEDSQVPHNALHDARALALHILTQEQAIEEASYATVEAPLVEVSDDGVTGD